MADDIHFVDPVGESVKCGVCYGILHNPESGCQEGHTFCHDCITRLDRCPMCRAPYDQQRGFVKNRAVADLIQTLTIFCKHGKREDGGGDADDRPAKKAKTKNQRDADSGNSSPASGDNCDWRGPLSHLQHHIETECLFHHVPCSFATSGCKAVRERREMARHEQKCVYRPEQCRGCKQTFLHKELLQHTSACGDIIVSCERCGRSIRRKRQQLHESELCPEVEVACELAEFGCEERVKRKDEDKHARDYAGRHMTMMAGRIKKMESRMQKMKSRTQRIESIVQRMSEDRGAHITWRLSKWDALFAYLCFPRFSEWHEDSEGVKWRLMLRRTWQPAAFFGVYVQPDRVPTQQKCFRVSLKQPCITRQSSHKWEAQSRDNNSGASKKEEKEEEEKSDASVNEEQKQEKEEEQEQSETSQDGGEERDEKQETETGTREEEKEKKEENEDTSASSNREEKTETQAVRCERCGWHDFVHCMDVNVSNGIEFEATVYTDIDVDVE